MISFGSLLKKRFIHTRKNKRKSERENYTNNFKLSSKIKIPFTPSYHENHRKTFYDVHGSCESMVKISTMANLNFLKKKAVKQFSLN